MRSATLPAWSPKQSPAPVPVALGATVTGVHPAFEDPKRQAAVVLSEKLGLDPALVGPWPPMLPVEIALRVAPVKELCAAYGIDRAAWEVLRTDDHFALAVQNAVELSHREGYSFRMKAKMQAEAMLQTTWTLIHSTDTPPSVKADLIKTTMRIAGYDKPEGVAGGGGAFQININLG